jgi:nucleotide-binding universal stress UspA family protein
MTARAIPTRTPLSAGAAELRLTPASPANRTTPIVAAVDGSSASRSAIEIAVKLAVELSDAPLVFVYVRRGPAGFLGTPIFQRRLTAEMARARRALARALRSAARAGVNAEGEILEGSPHERILEFARDRGARLIVVGSRGRKRSRSVSRAVVRAAERPVVVARGGRPLLLAR